MNSYLYVGGNPVTNVDPVGGAAFKNNSEMPIPYKPESRDNVIQVCPPHEWCNVDGVYSPPGTPLDRCSIVKIPDNCVGRIDSSGGVKVYCLIPEMKTPCPVTEGTLRQADFSNWPNPYTGDNWPYRPWR
jgi:hypothetical protein